MPTYKYQAMDNLGKEVKDQVDAASEEDAQQKIKNMGYFVTQLTEVASKKTKGTEVFKTTTVKNQYGQTVYKNTTTSQKKKKK